MIKRDKLQRIVVTTVEDEELGQTSVETPMEVIPAHVSIISSLAEMSQYGTKGEMILHTVTDTVLDKDPMTRFRFNDKLFKMVRQIGIGNEYFQTLLEVNN